MTAPMVYLPAGKPIVIVPSFLCKFSSMMTKLYAELALIVLVDNDTVRD